MDCLESVRLLSERRDHPLPPGKRIALRLHLLVCALCRGYRKQLEVVLRICHRAGDEASSHAPHLSPERRQAIQAAIDRSRR